MTHTVAYCVIKVHDNLDNQHTKIKYPAIAQPSLMPDFESYWGNAPFLAHFVQHQKTTKLVVGAHKLAAVGRK